MSTKVIYWSGTGNTEAMANAIAEGANISATSVDQASINDIEGAKTIFLGCSSQGDEILEEDEFLPFLESAQNQFFGKNVVLFGSYDWGNGEWMADWENLMKDWGANVVENSVITTLYPENDVIEALKVLGTKYKA